MWHSTGAPCMLSPVGALPLKVGLGTCPLASHLAAARLTDFSFTLHPAPTASRQKLFTSHGIDLSRGRNQYEYLDVKSGPKKVFSVGAPVPPKVSLSPCVCAEGVRSEHMISLGAFEE